MSKEKTRINMWAECGDDYYYGRGGEAIDYEMARYFYAKAALKKHPRACYMLGVCFENGHGEEQNAETARVWYERAAGYGDENAKKRLAEIERPGEEIGEEQSPVLARLREMETGNKEFWARYAADRRALARRLESLSLPVMEKAQTYRELDIALKAQRKRALTDAGDYAALTLALLAVKAKLGGAALCDGETVRAYLTDLLPNIREMRRLSALVFDTDAIDFLRDEPQKALQKLKARGLSGHEAERLIDCFGLAFAVPVVYDDLTDDSPLAAAECGGMEA